MAYDYSDLWQQAHQWAQQAYQQGWITEELYAPFKNPIDKEVNKDNDLNRPLLIAFMGGTGVGKSALLNRLAGKPIAQSGEARPTSREVTLFHHQSAKLPNCPLHDIRIAQHTNDAHKNRVWIDMPDFDSTDSHNRALVLQWLPWIDVVIYVVSPERYKDIKAWQLLRAEGMRHAWLFVMNHWDRGQEAQALDFIKQLNVAGFSSPLIFKTSCLPNGLDVVGDDFEQLTQTLTSLATQKTVTELEQRHTQQRIVYLKHALDDCANHIDKEPAFKQLQNVWQSLWQPIADQLQQGFAWRIPILAEHLALHAGDMLAPMPSLSLWDSWAQTRFEEVLNKLEIEAQSLNLPIQPLSLQLSGLRVQTADKVHQCLEWHTRQALLQRGNLLQRLLLKLMQLAEIILPLSAMSWVGYQVVEGYYESNQHLANYLSVDFAIHSTLLCAVAWLVPFFILKKGQPSLKNCALRGLNKGLKQGLTLLNTEVIVAQQQATMAGNEQTQQITLLLSQCHNALSLSQHSNDHDETLKRMLIPPTAPHS